MEKLPAIWNRPHPLVKIWFYAGNESGMRRIYGYPEGTRPCKRVKIQDHGGHGGWTVVSFMLMFFLAS